MSLFQLLTFDSWHNINNQFRARNNPIATNLFFISWVFLGAFIFRNIVVSAMGNSHLFYT